MLPSFYPPPLSSKVGVWNKKAGRTEGKLVSDTGRVVVEHWRRTSGVEYRSNLTGMALLSGELSPGRELSPAIDDRKQLLTDHGYATAVAKTVPI